MDLNNLSDSVEEQKIVYVERKGGNGLAVASLVLGIIGVVFGFIPLTFFIALALGLVGLVLGIPAILRARRTKQSGVMAWTGTIISAGAIALGCWGAVIMDDVVTELDQTIEEFDRDMQKASDDYDREMEKIDQEMERLQQDLYTP